MKTCTKCGIEKELSDFSKNYKKMNLLSYFCKECNNKRLTEYFKTKKGLITKIYNSQIAHSKKRGHKLPQYTKQELINWLSFQDNFEELYNNYKKSGYKKDLTPSIDRLNDYKSYTFDNIQLMTWNENKNKGHSDRKNGINNKHSKAVIGTYKITGKKIEFYSIKEAERQTGINPNSIIQCCKGNKNYSHAGGFKWKYL